MKFVALVSGGKDSIYNTMECVRHGHELVCLANLYPPDTTSDEADSFMYQSAAHTAIEAQAECFGKPLIRRELAGHAVNQSLQYVPTEDDEVEDLFLLLQEVKARFPDLQGVGSGAILSNYQRTRVENVCGRLGLTSLAYLWRRPQSSLLSEMVAAGVDAVLVKVASFGLEPSKHLGRSLARLKPFFESLHKKCGFHVCGEGGEYETLTLNCPLFVRKLVLDETVVVHHSEDMFAPVGLLRVVKCHTEPKEKLAEREGIETAAVDPSNKSRATLAVEPPLLARVSVASPRTIFLPHVHEGSGGLVYLSGVRSPGDPLELAGAPSAVVGGVAAVAAAAAAAQVARCLSAARAALNATGVIFRDVCFVHLYLADMGHFGAVNKEYCKWFVGENPPSRSCVSARLPAGCLVMLDLVGLRGSGEALAREGAACDKRQVLHVRSVSSWAPVCIGPYCQANTLGPAGAIALIAGQIGLQPATMVLPPRPPGPIPVLTTKTAGAGNDNDSGRDRNGCGSGGDGGHEGVPSSFHGPELELSVSHASSVASAVGASVSRGCVFATLYVSEEAAIAAAAANKSEAQEATTLNEEGRNREKEGEGDWLQNLVEDCRRRIEGWFSREYAEAVAEAAGTGAAGPGVEGDEGEDSAEEGWTSDPEELAKEAARKRVLVRDIPILPLVVPSLPKGSAVELEVLCMSRAALSVLPCKFYPPVSRSEILAPPRTTGLLLPLTFTPEAFAARVDGRDRDYQEDQHGNGNDSSASVRKKGGLVARAITVGSTVDRILCAASCSLCVTPQGASATLARAMESSSKGAATAEPTSVSGVNEKSLVDVVDGQQSSSGSLERACSTHDGHLLTALSATQLEKAAALTLCGVADAVSTARLGWGNVANLRVYYCSRQGADHSFTDGTAPKEGGGDVSTDGDDAKEVQLEKAMLLALSTLTRERPAMTFVPVCSLAEEALVCVHATAWDLDRLRTELWVRGAP